MRVAPVDRGPGLGIQPVQFLREGLHAVFAVKGLQAFAQRGIGRRQRVQFEQQGIDVEPGTAGDHHGTVPFKQFLEHRQGRFRIGRSAHVLVNAQVPDEVVLHPEALLLRGLGRTDRKLTVELPGIGTDHLGPQFPRHLRRQGRFPAGRGAADHDGRGRRQVSSVK